MEAAPREEVGGTESREMRDSTAELQLMLCRFAPVTGLKGIKLRPLASDLAPGFSLTPSRYGRRCPPLGIAPASSAVPGLGAGREELCFPRTVLEGTMLCPVFPRVLRIHFH